MTFFSFSLLSVALLHLMGQCWTLNQQEVFDLEAVVQEFFTPIYKLYDVSVVPQVTSEVSFDTSNKNNDDFGSGATFREIHSHSSWDTKTSDPHVISQLRMALKQEFNPVYVALGLIHEGMPTEADLQTRPEFLG